MQRLKAVQNEIGGKDVPTETGGEVEGESIGGESPSSSTDWVLCAGAHNTAGYGIVKHVDEHGMAHVQLPWGVTCYTPSSDLKRSVDISITTFASLPRRPVEAPSDIEEKKESEDDRLQRLYKMLEKSQLGSEEVAPSEPEPKANSADQAAEPISPEEQKAMAAQDKPGDKPSLKSASTSKDSDSSGKQKAVDNDAASDGPEQSAKPDSGQDASENADAAAKVPADAEKKKPEEALEPSQEQAQEEKKPEEKAVSEEPIIESKPADGAAEDAPNAANKSNAKIDKSGIDQAAVASKLGKSLESRIATMRKVVSPAKIKQQISKLSQPKDKPAPEMVRLKPCGRTFQVTETVSDIISFLCQQYDEFGLLPEEVRLVNRGKELHKLDETIAEAQILPPCRLLFVLQRKHSDYGGFVLMAGNLQVSPDNLLVTNTGSFDKWRPIRCKEAVGGSGGGVYSFEVKIVASTQTANSWRFCVGCVSASFRENADRCWVGSQPKSWAYIAGTGGKCNNAGQSTPYGEEYGEGDIIRMELDFDRNTIEFFRNEISQGIAFSNLEGEVYPAVSLTGTMSAVQIVT